MLSDMFRRIENNNRLLNRPLNILENTNESSMPDRFVANEQNNREVIINDSDNRPNDLTDLEYKELNDEKTENIHNIPSHQSEFTSSARQPIEENTIERLVDVVKNVISTTNIKPPNFTSTTRVGYRKIKNFIRNITKVWLTQNEVDKFVKEFNRNPSN